MSKAVLIAVCLFSSMVATASSQMCGQISYLKINARAELEVRFHDMETTYYAENKFGNSAISLFTTAIAKEFPLCLEEFGKLDEENNRQSFKTVMMSEKIPFPTPNEQIDNKPDVASTSIITH